MFSALSAPSVRAAGTAAAPRFRAPATMPCAAGPWAAAPGVRSAPALRTLRTAAAAAGAPAARVLADDAPEEPHLRVDAAQFRAALAAEEENDEFEELEEGEVVEVDAAATPDDSLAVRGGFWGGLAAGPWESCGRRLGRVHLGASHRRPPRPGFLRRPSPAPPPHSPARLSWRTST